MVQFSNSIETTVANHSEAMDASDHFKNGVSSKNLTSRANFKIRLLFSNLGKVATMIAFSTMCVVYTVNAQITEPNKFLNLNAALVIVDGKEGVDINNISPESVVFFSVLKDQSAIEKYGEKGKNGVVIITTKSNQTVKVGTSLKAQFNNEKYDKESFLIGTLNEYMYYQRTFTNGSTFYNQRVDIMSQKDLQHALFIDSLFNLDYSDITIVNNGASQGIKIYSPTLSLKIDDYYNYVPLNIRTSQGDTIYGGHLKKEKFETEKQKLSFLLGVCLRNAAADRAISRSIADFYSRTNRDVTELQNKTNQDVTNFLIQSLKKENLLDENCNFENSFSFPNAPSKAKVCTELLKDLDCHVEYVVMRDYIPVGHKVLFIPSNKIREVINEAERLLNYIETIDTNHVEFTLGGSKFILDEPEKPFTKTNQPEKVYTPLFVVDGNAKNNTDQLIGVWKFVSSTSPMSANIEIVKIITKGYFVCIHIRDNVITTSFGGTCSLDGETYIENILFGTQNRNDIDRTGTFKINFEDKKMYLSGLVSGSNRVPFSEVWERVE